MGKTQSHQPKTRYEGTTADLDVQLTAIAIRINDEYDETGFIYVLKTNYSFIMKIC